MARWHRLEAEVKVNDGNVRAVVGSLTGEEGQAVGGYLVVRVG